ncbi:aldo/keto reductase [Rhodobacter veldkampii DSM 11550]|uniref:Aldo/keto reductase n=1 Tax=Phaeovulum veldkampii DSM 11550 TaxID=1185920 RepID=A0A2T4JMD2_9RHOB|nr:aldo/keto reductase [Phaeovulum veldkampii]MBK5946286.1 aldo/keto reductase [Phaeovulum veldkampii DSM 11550]NCU20340.1 aldo/keto reductase [Candidatus Falkowbacteria bacterium]PTE19070.1 aldo/keto reductase [Phaeovulum veldkampii DSM 11550]TDQ61378.1 aryl-alcohol dehydrogenase-like predicted oxidoreductase [Phaeovulum veldkampii DSM 11550]
MRKVRLGRNGPEVSEICLGSMTWGTQNTEAEGHAQIDRALDRGVTFIDTAEMYPVNPVAAETAGRTEEIIGSWLARSGRRGDVVIATKITGVGSKAARDGAPITPAAIRAAVEGSLRRLRTDHIDIYQLHWPNRGSYHFRQHWRYDAGGRDRAAVRADMGACLEAIAALVAEGKIGHFALSNETAWGMAEWLRLAEAGLGPRAISVQNEYSLLCRMYDTDLAELGVMEDVTLLAYSPLAAGLLSGKYTPEVTPQGSRRSINPDLGGRITPRVWPAVAAYRQIAATAGLDPVTMAIAFVLGRPFPVVPIVGATSVAQLDRALDAAGLTLPEPVQREIAAAWRAHALPF